VKLVDVGEFSGRRSYTGLSKS